MIFFFCRDIRTYMRSQSRFLACTIALFFSLNVGCDLGGSQTLVKTEIESQQAQGATAELDRISRQLEQSKTRTEEMESPLIKSQDKVKLTENRVFELTAEPEDANQKFLTTQKALAKIQSRGRDGNSKPGLFQANLFSWNVESDGSDPEVIAKQLAEFGQYDIYGLTEVLPDSFELFRSAVGEGFASIDSKTGQSDRMQIIYDNTRFELLRQFELHEINYKLRYRSPLVAHLRDKNSGTEFLVMVNHLARGKADVRAKQAEQLVQWARDQTLPIIALGDYNYDYVFADRQGNEGFRKMMRDNVWKWIEPDELIDTNWFDNPESPDGKDDYPGSMLDFAFVAGPAKDWETNCQIITRANDFPDDSTNSDHRPYKVQVNMD